MDDPPVLFWDFNPISVILKYKHLKYQEATQSNVDVKDIQRSIDILKNSDLEYMFRTTVVPGLIEAEDIENIGKMLQGSKVFQIQQFKPETTVDESYLNKKPLPREEIQAMAEIAQAYFTEVRVEGI